MGGGRWLAVVHPSLVVAGIGWLMFRHGVPSRLRSEVEGGFSVTLSPGPGIVLAPVVRSNFSLGTRFCPVPPFAVGFTGFFRSVHRSDPAFSSALVHPSGLVPGSVATPPRRGWFRC